MLPGNLDIPPIDSAALPPEVRNGTQDDRRLYSVALGFERILVEQLTKQMSDSTSLLSDDSDEDSDSFGAASSSMFKEQLPATLADGIVAGGGLGLASELYRDLKGAAS
jgi:Rod binding domain-containing protein